MSGVLASVPEPHQSPRPAPSRGLFRESHCNNLNIDCGTDSTADVSACACNAGYYGTGRACLPCRACPANASLVTPCPAGAAADVSVCACNVGFYGDGTVCLPCAAEVRPPCAAKTPSVGSEARPADPTAAAAAGVAAGHVRRRLDPAHQRHAGPPAGRRRLVRRSIAGFGCLSPPMSFGSAGAAVFGRTRRACALLQCITSLDPPPAVSRGPPGRRCNAATVDACSEAFPAARILYAAGDDALSAAAAQARCRPDTVPSAEWAGRAGKWRGLMGGGGAAEQAPFVPAAVDSATAGSAVAQVAGPGPGLAESPCRPSRESAKTPSRPTRPWTVRRRAAPRRSLEALRLAALAVDFSHSLATGTEIEERTATLAASHLLAD